MSQESRLVIVIDSKNAERNARSLANELDSIERTGDFATKSTDRLSVATRQLAGYMAGIVTVSKAVSMADGYTQMAARIRNATDDAKEYDLVQKRLFDTANSTYRALSEAQEVYLGLSGGMNALGYATKDTLDVSDSLSFSFVANAARADQAQSAIDSFSKSMAKGKIDADAWISIVSAADNIIADMSKTTGMSEVQIRKLGAEGKISLEDLIRTLKETRDQNKALADSMENSLADGLTKLSNGVTRYLGELNLAMGVTGEAAGALGVLADNIETVMDVAMLGGVAYLTKAIISQTTAMRTRIATSVVDRQASIAQLQAQYAEATAAANAAKAHLANVQATNAEATAKYGAVAANARYKLASDAVTVSVNAQTAAQLRLNAATSVAGRLAKGAFGLIGGWAGVATLGVTGLAAAYMYMQNSAEKANEKLKEQAQVADKTEKELTKLIGNDKKKAIEDLTSAFENQNKELRKSELAVGSALISIQNYAKGNAEVAKISKEARLGTISYTEAVERLNNVNIPTDLYEKLKETVKLYDQNAEGAEKSRKALGLFGIEVRLVGNATQNAAIQQSRFNDTLVSTKTAANEAKKSLQELYAERLFDASFVDELMKRGYSESKAKDLLKAYRDAAKLGLDKIDSETSTILRKTWDIEESIKSKTDSRTDSIRQQNKELEKQVQLGQRLVGISGNSGIGTGAHLDVRYGGSRDGQKVSREHLERLQAGGKPLTQYRVSSGYGPRKAPTKGASSFHKGIDFAMPVGTPITTNVAVKDVKTAYDSKGGGYYSTVTFEDGVVLKLLHQAPSMKSKVKGGASSGSENGSKSKTYEQQLDLQKSLELEVANEILRIRENLKDRLADVDEAGFSPERAAVVKAQLQERADNDIAIAQQAIKTKLDDFKQFTKSEEQLLRDSFAKRQFDALHDLELTKEQRKEAVNLLDQQLKQELGLLKLAQEQRLFQAKQFLYSEVEAIKERYRLEREEIDKTIRDEAEKRKRLSLSRDQERLDLLDRAAQANRSWGGTYAGMTGNSQQFQFEQERIEQTSQSYQLAEALEALSSTAEERETIWQAHNDRMLMIDQNYWANTTALQLNTASSVFGTLTSLAEGYAGKQSGIYKTLWAAERSFSIASVFASNSVALAKAWSSAPFPANLPAVGITAAETGVLQAALKAFNPKGFADGGYTGNGLKHTPAGIVHKGEVVWSQDDIKRWGGVSIVESMRNSSPKGYADGGYVSNSTAVRREARQFDAINTNRQNEKTENIQISQSITFSDGGAKMDTQGQKDVAQSLNAAMDAWARRESRQGGVLYNLTRK
ncbi:tape measure protein [Acinetobacter haemolyticus]|uniref:tape measure protein n=1 Tax=Acinetobacter haemolyticus TaxID=29430 RepID=UPI0013732013|nr:tape measure protein [Acinetobacter haemolyticus]NAR50102.1 tape measure protein [Acinetobacter haemolyticus]NAR54358.1 tape measure protein [Acinetobacter haemolyticus]